MKIDQSMPVTSVECRPGQLASAEVVQVPQLPGTQAWRITYWSRDTHDRPHLVGGIVLVPEDVWTTGIRPVVGYAASARGLADHCAPSLLLTQGTDMEAPLLAEYLGRGFAVAVSDYEGMGLGGAPTFVAGRSQAHAVLDVVRAALALEPARLDPAAPVALTGYSQGGQASGWAAQLAPTYAPELSLQGVAVGGPPPDYETSLKAMDGTIGSAIGAAVAIGLDAAYAELRLRDHLTDRGREVIDSAFADDIATFAMKNAFLRHDDWVSDELFRREDWVARGSEQVLGEIAPLVPVLIYHSEADDVLPYQGAVDLSRSWTALGADVHLLTLQDGEGHLAAQFSAGPQAAEWVGRVLEAP